VAALREVRAEWGARAPNSARSMGRAGSCFDHPPPLKKPSKTAGSPRIYTRDKSYYRTLKTEGARIIAGRKLAWDPVPRVPFGTCFGPARALARTQRAAGQSRRRRSDKPLPGAAPPRGGRSTLAQQLDFIVYQPEVAWSPGDRDVLLVNAPRARNPNLSICPAIAFERGPFRFAHPSGESHDGRELLQMLFS
jgi:hypothetical protein